jgi:hypothetical protein
VLLVNALGLAKTLRALLQVPSRVSAAVADRLNVRLIDGFDAGTDPYNVPWGPLRPMTLAKGRTPPPLDETGALRSQVYVAPRAGAGLDIHAPDGSFHGAAQHMSGRAHPLMVARPFVPTNGLPATWRADIQDETATQTRKSWDENQ